MDSILRPTSTYRLIDLGLEYLPWIGIAVGLVFYVPPEMAALVPGAAFWLPAATIGLGTAVVICRRLTTPSDADRSTSEQLESTTVEGASASSPTVSPGLLEDSARGEHTFDQDSVVDALTGLATRSALLDQLSHLLSARDQSNQDLGLLSVTIDEYRDVTESFGYDAGQQLLTTVATRIDRNIPPTATAARITEDTFSILLTQSGGDRAREIGDSLFAQFSNPFEIAGHRIPLEASVGLATQADRASGFTSAENMLQASYSAMHQATRSGSAEINVSTPEDGRASPWLERRERLRKAVQNDELLLHYQPVVHLVSEEIVGAEALVRWDHPERGLLRPSAFIPLAEETGLVGEIDRWVVEEAMRQATEWTASPDGPVDWVSVNVSPQSTEGDLATWCRERLNSRPLPEGALHLEITERWALEDERALRPLRDEGVRLAIDDFGTGYSSLRYLRSLDADVLKIDREFIHELGRDPKTTAIVQFLLNLSLRLDVAVIAEGVETAEQEDVLRELGCAMAQGYHFSKPVPPKVLTHQADSSESRENDEPATPLQPA